MKNKIKTIITLIFMLGNVLFFGFGRQKKVHIPLRYKIQFIVIYLAITLTVQYILYWIRQLREEIIPEKIKIWKKKRYERKKKEAFARFREIKLERKAQGKEKLKKYN